MGVAKWEWNLWWLSIFCENVKWERFWPFLIERHPDPQILNQLFYGPIWKDVALKGFGSATQNMLKSTPDRWLALILFGNKNPYSLQYLFHQKSSQKCLIILSEMHALTKQYLRMKRKGILSQALSMFSRNTLSHSSLLLSYILRSPWK